MIPIDVRSQVAVSERDIQQFAEHRIGFALDHLRNIRRISIAVGDINGPKGGADKHCRLVADLGFTSMVIEEIRPNWHSAVARAIHRLDQKATRELQRMNRSYSHGPDRTRFRGLRTTTSRQSNNAHTKPVSTDNAVNSFGSATESNSRDHANEPRL
jgi:putative sigma-54 modulation protein